MNRKPRILIMSDSPFLDTGFGRVAREIGTHLVETGNYVVAQLAWFHSANDRIVPFQVFPTSGKPGDQYGQLSFDEVASRFKPDVVMAMGDHWMVKHLAGRPRNYKLVGYFPVDGLPIRPEVADIFAAFDHAVFYGNFGAQGATQAKPSIACEIIPHGVDVEAFHPLTSAERLAVRKTVTGADNSFLVGMVGRNNSRKQLPRLLKAFSAFVKGWTSCQDCGAIAHGVFPQCRASSCVSRNVKSSPPKDDAYLYLHCRSDDNAGHDLHDLIKRYGLIGRVAMPQNYSVGHGCSDVLLNQIYNAMDVFTLPTGGEGWCLPALEAMASGVPILMTDYSGHLDFCAGYCETIGISDYVTQTEGNVEHAIVDLVDYERKLDRFYYDYQTWMDKWGVMSIADLQQAGADVEGIKKHLPNFSYGQKLCHELGDMGHKRAQEFAWPVVLPMWPALFNKILGHDPASVVALTGASAKTVEAV